MRTPSDSRLCIEALSRMSRNLRSAAAYLPWLRRKDLFLIVVWLFRAFGAFGIGAGAGDDVGALAGVAVCAGAGTRASANAGASLDAVVSVVVLVLVVRLLLLLLITAGCCCLLLAAAGHTSFAEQPL